LTRLPEPEESSRAKAGADRNGTGRSVSSCCNGLKMSEAANNAAEAERLALDTEGNRENFISP
jgi:hypothetical protein